MIDSNVKEKVLAGKLALSEKVAEIRADESLSEQGRATELAKAYASTLATHRQLVAENARLVEQRRAELIAKAVQMTPGDSARAALAVAMAAPSLGELVSVARLTGDRTLAQAAAAVATVRGDSATLRDLATDNEALRELAEFEEAGKSAIDRVATGMTLAEPSMPRGADQRLANEAI